MDLWPYCLIGGLVVGEAAAGRWWFREPLYGLRDSEVGLALAIGWALGATVTAVLSAAAFAVCYQHRALTLPDTPLTLLLLVVLADLTYYGWHWAAHHVGWLWATHSVHHSAPRMNALAAIRQGWTDILSGTWLVWAPLGLLGFSPASIAIYFAVLFVWEALIHNAWAPRLGPLEWVFVTPSHHRVHHSLLAEHWNRNYGGLLIVWDRFFGTYAAEGPERLRAFGLPDVDDAMGPLGIVAHGWREWAAVKGFASRQPAPRPDTAPIA
jgi:sterol desaturase/sphingolipid hydroxylase (fatty acid hydroxylase superfamily)